MICIVIWFALLNAQITFDRSEASVEDPYEDGWGQDCRLGPGRDHRLHVPADWWLPGQTQWTGCRERNVQVSIQVVLRYNASLFLHDFNINSQFIWWEFQEKFMRKVILCQRFHMNLCVTCTNCLCTASCSLWNNKNLYTNCTVILDVLVSSSKREFCTLFWMKRDIVNRHIFFCTYICFLLQDFL